jgi:hypothetical protein
MACFLESETPEHVPRGLPLDPASKSRPNTRRGTVLRMPSPVRFATDRTRSSQCPGRARSWLLIPLEAWMFEFILYVLSWVGSDLAVG